MPCSFPAWAGLPLKFYNSQNCHYGKNAVFPRINAALRRLGPGRRQSIFTVKMLFPHTRSGGKAVLFHTEILSACLPRPLPLSKQLVLETRRVFKDSRIRISAQATGLERGRHCRPKFVLVFQTRRVFNA